MLGMVVRVDAGSYVAASELLPWCESDKSPERDICGFYLAGVLDATDTWVAWGVMSKQICIPDTLRLSQLGKIFVEGAKKRPESMHLGADSLALDALHEAFPCE